MPAKTKYTGSSELPTVIAAMLFSTERWQQAGQSVDSPNTATTPHREVESVEDHPIKQRPIR